MNENALAGLFDYQSQEKYACPVGPQAASLRVFHITRRQAACGPTIRPLLTFTAANSNTVANTRRSVSESNFFAPNVEPTTPPATAAMTQTQRIGRQQR